jgi:hypothetical protein
MPAPLSTPQSNVRRKFIDNKLNAATRFKTRDCHDLSELCTSFFTAYALISTRSDLTLVFCNIVKDFFDLPFCKNEQCVLLTPDDVRFSRMVIT